MSEAPVDPTSTGAWSRLTALAQGFEPDLRAWFADEPDRVERLTFTPPTSTSTCRSPSSTTRCSAALLALADEVGVGGPPRRDVRR